MVRVTLQCVPWLHLAHFSILLFSAQVAYAALLLLLSQNRQTGLD